MITGFIGTTELLLIGGLALLLVGGKKLPEMMRGLGKGVREFKDGMKEGDSCSRKEEEDSESSREELPRKETDFPAEESQETPGNKR